MSITLTHSSEILSQLQENTESIRNISIMGHVGHGKTTLTDALLASNGIISANTIRLMDSREMEQIRDITMKSSTVSLVHQKGLFKFLKEYLILIYLDNKKYLINLIDTPEHLDFSSDVSTEVQLCDGAIILVDVVEGLSSQTLSALRQASIAHLRIILVLNKIDRLFVELKMNPFQAYLRIRDVLKHINDVIAEQFISLLLEKNVEQEDVMEKGNNDDSWTKNQSRIYFSPDYHNVLFGSTLDGFAFGIHHFADIYAKKLSIKREILMKTLWGDYYFDKKSNCVCEGAQDKKEKPMFVECILENLWSAYNAIIIQRKNEKIEKIATSIGVKLTPEDIQNTDPYVPFRLIFKQWLPITSAVFDMIVVQLPNPKELNIKKIEQLMCNKTRRFNTLLSQTQQLKQAFINCSSDDQEPVIVYISKLFYVKKNTLSQNKHKSLTTDDIVQEHDENVCLAFARIYSGRLKKGEKMFVLNSSHDPTLFVGKNLNEVSAHSISNHVHEFIIQDLYLMMDQEFILLDQVPAGNIVGIGQLDSLVLKSATLSTNLFCPSFSDIQFQSSSIVRVTIKPKDSSQMEQLRDGMHRLNQVDPFVECILKDTNEYILSTASQEHLQQCIDDLTKKYARIEINVSTPIISFHETTIIPSKIDFLNQQQFKSNKTNEGRLSSLGNGLVELIAPNDQYTFQIRAVELPNDIVLFLKIHSELLKTIEKAQGRDDGEVIVKLNKQTLKKIRQLRKKLNEKFINANLNIWNSNTVDEIWSFSPDKCGSNLLINRIPNNIYKQHGLSIWSIALNNQTFTQDDYDLSIIKGFQLVTTKGFLCDDPVDGVAFILEKWTINPLNEIESSIETIGITTKQSLTLYIQQKSCLILDKSFSHQIVLSIRQVCKIAHYNRVPFVQINDSNNPNNPEVDFDASKIRYTTIYTQALSTCRGFLLTGNVNQQEFVYLAHKSRGYEAPAHTLSSALVEILLDITQDIEIKMFNYPPPNADRELKIFDLKNLKLLVCGSIPSEADLTIEACRLLKNKNIIQDLLKADRLQWCLYLCQQLKYVTIIPPVTYLVSSGNSSSNGSNDSKENTDESKNTDEATKNEPSVCLNYSCDSQMVQMLIEWATRTLQYDIAHLSIDYKTIEENDLIWKLAIDRIDKAQEELDDPKDLKDFNDALSYVLSTIDPPPISQHHSPVLITIQAAHPWTIMGFNQLHRNVNVIFTFKCDSLIASHGLLIDRNHIFAAPLDHPSIYIWNLNRRDQDYKKLTVAGPVSSMTFIGDSSVLACAIGNKIFLYKLDDSGRHLITLSGHIRTINNLLFHESENCLISAGEDTSIHRWNIEEIPVNIDQNIDLTPTKSFQGHTGHIHDLCQILIGRFHLLLTGSSDFSVRLWDIVTGTCLCTFLFPNEIHSICVSSFSKTIYCGTAHGKTF